MVLALMVGWIVFSYAFAEFAPIILLGLCHLIGFLFLCLWEVLKLAARIIGWILRQVVHCITRMLRRVANAVYLGCALLYFMADEWWRGPPEQAQSEDAERDVSGDQPLRETENNDYEKALSLLGLTPGFTKEALKRAYRTTMRAAHPDGGGSAQAAQAVNGAYDFVLQVHGWSR
ncbi:MULTISPECIES: hypothetical protein [unclassified Mesorhizobium]|uniref:J domain-containing protein n=1 Tax=unclassified Mesorhizobium TaxID=325217 RepID=UPI0024170646|nr:MULTISPECIES: hypothetical protein [unclassified Mesorhizobium]MDG4901417.1 hypothetical protein [Mesorhizobium sp. WSM4962]MDG4918905.1 hypothetical protein [Mesorhizobium sp. WSM4989]